MKTKNSIPILDSLIHSLKTDEIDNSAELLSPKEVSAELKLHINTVYRIIQGGQLRAYNLSEGDRKTYYRIRRQDMENYLDERYCVR